MRRRKRHLLKTWPEFFDALATREKRFELRRADRDYQRGDLVEFVRFDPGSLEAEKNCPTQLFRVGWMMFGPQFGLESGYVAFQLEPVRGSWGARAKGGAARADKLAPEDRAAIARSGAAARWSEK